MTMTAKGLAKLIEECGELQQVAGKMLAYYHHDQHPDGGPPLRERLEDEAADVMAAIDFVAQTFRLDSDRMLDRSQRKFVLFTGWHEDPKNNALGVDMPAPRACQFCLSPACPSLRDPELACDGQRYPF